jgi:spore coat polysaccharide biosynthesis protein SpsF
MNVAFIQVRTSSKRFNKKVLKKIDNNYLFLNVYNRVKVSRRIDKIIILTSTHKSDDVIEKICLKKNISYFRGSLNNVLKRYCDAIKVYKPDYIVRINGDSPFIDYKIINKALGIYNKNSFDIVTNVNPRTYPKGQSVEVCNSKVLQNILKKVKKKEHKEHVTSYIYSNPKNFKILNFEYKTNLYYLQFSVDTKNDFTKIKKMFFYLKNKSNKNLLLRLINIHRKEII